ncbi:MAG TPA: radical SAM protein [bacterium]|nr:radical SAM protein [bacterium]
MIDIKTFLKPGPGAPFRSSLSLDPLYRAHDELAFGNPAWSQARTGAKFLLVRLSPFRDVQRSTPHEFLYREIRKAIPNAYIDFSFFPTARDRTMFSQAGIPFMHGVASARGALEFDHIFVSNAYTLELINLAPALEASGIEATRLAREREEQAGHEPYPLLVLGGSNAMASPALYDEANGDSLVDALFFGEGEGSVGRLAVELAATPSRAALARIAGMLTGFWPTALRMPVVQATADHSAFPPGIPPVLAGEEAGTLRLEITRGCPSFCNFCFEGWERKPYREQALASIIEQARLIKTGTGADSIELASYNFNAHADIVSVILQLQGLFQSVTFQSQRVDILARSPGLIRFEVAAGKRSFTVGVEGISERMRAYYNKELCEADLRLVLERIVREGAREIKLFYILAGFEAASDLAEFRAFMAWLAGVMNELPTGTRPRVVCSAGPLIRMPFTPLAYEALRMDRKFFDALTSTVRDAVESRGFEYRAPEPFDEYCLSQVLALAPQESLSLLVAMSRHGYLYDKTLTDGAWAFARGFLQERGALNDTYLASKPPDHRFPYPFLLPSVTPGTTYRRYQDAVQGIERQSCLGGSCLACGACTEEERSFLANHRFNLVSERDMRGIEAVVEAKRHPSVIFVQAELPANAATAAPAYAATLFRRELYARLPSVVDIVWTSDDVFIQSKDGCERLPEAYGATWHRIVSARPLDTTALEAAGYTVSEAPLRVERLELSITFSSADLQQLCALISQFMTSMAIPHTLKKSGATAGFAISEKGRKKRNVLEAIMETLPDHGMAVHLVCGSKYDLGLLKTMATKRKLMCDIRVDRLYTQPKTI